MAFVSDQLFLSCIALAHSRAVSGRFTCGDVIPAFLDDTESACQARGVVSLSFPPWLCRQLSFPLWCQDWCVVSVSTASPGVSRLVLGVFVISSPSLCRQLSLPWGVKTSVGCLLAQHLLGCQDWCVVSISTTSLGYQDWCVVSISTTSLGVSRLVCGVY